MTTTWKVLSLASLAMALSACGVQGNLERPAPLFGEASPDDPEPLRAGEFVRGESFRDIDQEDLLEPDSGRGDEDGFEVDAGSPLENRPLAPAPAPTPDPEPEPDAS